ncbi:two-component sensor histidine kinase [Thioalkalivibrio denitrificans]|uniref:histidine kinase n=1 Tax=Thioalkalivibrio denitrificans TaxID=108003 RepID=A0A1V3NG11_9GAMM|nr:HAMP domain-containing sensor histidine kinase [Thioalkalivibrio denitrificans]OOG23863.1 two-component sensor histidine kinase [Thioalkalivibrio denitrificans]
MLLRNLSFRYKIPLRATVLVLITAVLITGAILAREYDQVRRDLFENAESMGRLLSNTLVTPLLHDDVWRAYEIIDSPFKGEESALGAELIMVLDTQRRVYVSTQPRNYPMLVPLDELGPAYADLNRALGNAPDLTHRAVDLPNAAQFHMVAPIVFDGVHLGTLVMEYPKSLFIPRFVSIVGRAALVTLLVLVVLLPVSWYWGRRMADPLVRLSECMGRVGREIPLESECRLYESKDEIGRAGTQLKRMLSELRQKQELERGVMASERLAAVGRLTASIAHEINNPLGGMLNALSTYRRHGNPDAVTARTLSLLERGLLQIKETVGALLVEVRLEGHALTPQDLHDIHTLVLPDVHAKSLDLVWDIQVTQTLALPSTQVRQILLNLLLNAIQASEPGGKVKCRLRLRDGGLLMEVRNRGVPIPPEQMNRLFEPFFGASGRGHGLGLWVTYQLVQQMEGRIHVQSTHGTTEFRVHLPLRDQEAA